MGMRLKSFFNLIIFLISYSFTNAQVSSIVRDWNNILLEAIRNDFARPPVHARNLFHHSILMYDSWAAFSPGHETYFLNKTTNGYFCPFDGVTQSQENQKNIEKAISYASYRFITNRYQNSPDFADTYQLLDSMMNSLGFSISNTSTDYSLGPAELGNYIAEKIEEYGLNDGSLQSLNYINLNYSPVNPPIFPNNPGTNNILDPDHWQQISLPISIDQSGNIVSGIPEFVSAEWGNVFPFALPDSVLNITNVNGIPYKVYLDPGSPPSLFEIDTAGNFGTFYKWTHSMVSVWQSHLDPSDGYLIDISPSSIGNITQYPSNASEYSSFYNFFEGGDNGTGYSVNPYTGEPYTPNVVKRSDYARVLAEFWADGVDSETPPGHWFEIYHYASSKPEFELFWNGSEMLDTLEFEIKAHFDMGCAMHDAAIAAWSIKGYYDYVRPISAIRFMCEMGQSTDSTLTNYNPLGIELIDGFIEVVQVGDPLAGLFNENVGKIKLFTWLGPTMISNPETDAAGVGWMLGENWWPYQRPSFVTPPFAGYVSGHSTYSRAAADILTHITGSEYFPGGIGEFVANQNQFLQFEEGPTETITLQWAKYRDAADQCSLSRIWGGIHPSCDDIPGRNIGSEVANYVIDRTELLYSKTKPAVINVEASTDVINIEDTGGSLSLLFTFNAPIDTLTGDVNVFPSEVNQALIYQGQNWSNDSTLEINYLIENSGISIEQIAFQLENFLTVDGSVVGNSQWIPSIIIDQVIPQIDLQSISLSQINRDNINDDFILDIYFGEKMDTTIIPLVSVLNDGNVLAELSKSWLSDTALSVIYSIQNIESNMVSTSFQVNNYYDLAGNLSDSLLLELLEIDTKNPTLVGYSLSDTIFGLNDLSSNNHFVQFTFDESMDVSLNPTIELYLGSNFQPLISQLNSTSEWLNDSIYQFSYSLNFIQDYEENELTLHISNFNDLLLNSNIDSLSENIIVDFLKPEIISYSFNKPYISDSVVGIDQFFVELSFSESVSSNSLNPNVKLIDPITNTDPVQFNFLSSTFLNDSLYRAYYIVQDNAQEIESLNLASYYFIDKAGNMISPFIQTNAISLDTKNPNIVDVFLSDYSVEYPENSLSLLAIFNEQMYFSQPDIEFIPFEVNSFLSLENNSGWLNPYTYEGDFMFNGSLTQSNVGVKIQMATDIYGNVISENAFDGLLYIQILDLENYANEQFNVYPNPLQVGTKLLLMSKHSLDGKEYTIFNVSGQLEFSNVFDSNSNGEYELSTENLIAGFYILKLENQQIKFVIQ